jgi:hypothetical protein
LSVVEVCASTPDLGGIFALIGFVVFANALIIGTGGGTRTLEFIVRVFIPMIRREMRLLALKFL